MSFLDKFKAFLGQKQPERGGEFGGAGATGEWDDIIIGMRAAAPETDIDTINRFVDPISKARRRFLINNSARLAAFLAQTAHESMGYRRVREIASGAAYEGRIDLGNTEPGDGVRFAGRGLIQLTGRANYMEASMALYGDNRLVLAPQLVERPDNAVLVSGWYWFTRDLNELADLGDFVKITKRINGGLNGITDRTERWTRVRKALGVDV